MVHVKWKAYLAEPLRRWIALDLSSDPWLSKDAGQGIQVWSWPGPLRVVLVSPYLQTLTAASGSLLPSFLSIFGHQSLLDPYLLPFFGYHSVATYRLLSPLDTLDSHSQSINDVSQSEYPTPTSTPRPASPRTGLIDGNPCLCVAYIELVQQPTEHQPLAPPSMAWPF